MGTFNNINIAESTFSQGQIVLHENREYIVKNFNIFSKKCLLVDKEHGRFETWQHQDDLTFVR